MTNFKEKYPAEQVQFLAYFRRKGASARLARGERETRVARKGRSANTPVLQAKRKAVSEQRFCKILFMALELSRPTSL